MSLGLGSWAFGCCTEDADWDYSEDVKVGVGY